MPRHINRLRWLGAVAAGLALHAATAALAADTCPDPAYHQWDFIAGSWLMFDEKGAVIADETVAPELGDCVLHEYFVGKNMRAAQSMSYYDPVEKLWHQDAWGLGLIFRLKGGLKNGAMQLEGAITHISRGQILPLRAVWRPLPDGTVKEELSEQDPATGVWTTIFTGVLRRY